MTTAPAPARPHVPCYPAAKLAAANRQTWQEYRRDMDGRNLSPYTIAGYSATLGQLDGRYGRDWLDLAAADIRRFLAEIAAKHPSGATAELRYRHLRTFYLWAVREQLLPASPVATVGAPACDEPVLQIPRDADIRQLLAAVRRDRSPAGLRDYAIIRLFCEPGSPRASEMAALAVADVDLAADEVTVRRGKGGKGRRFAMGRATATAVSRYLRARYRLPGAAAAAALFLSQRRGGPLTRHGMLTLVYRRCDQAGIARLHPHAFRHWATAAHYGAAGTEREAEALFGWEKGSRMSRRYGAAAAAAQAVAASRRRAVTDQLLPA